MTPSFPAQDLSAQQWSSISAALATVNQLRLAQSAEPALHAALEAIKLCQCQRFAFCYADVLQHPDWSSAAHFFLQELYAARDFSQRDAEFARIAPAIERYFPNTVVALSTTLCQLHALSETLDHRMAQTLLALSNATLHPDAASALYVKAWRIVGQSPARHEQITLVQHLGEELNRLTRLPGLRLSLRLMRKPAHAAGLDYLQQFLEHGFDTFAELRRSKAGVTPFLQSIQTRETAWLERLFDKGLSDLAEPTHWPELKHELTPK
jgi:hypothetical protein